MKEDPRLDQVHKQLCQENKIDRILIVLKLIVLVERKRTHSGKRLNWC